jgi:hypothetical protein
MPDHSQAEVHLLISTVLLLIIQVDPHIIQVPVNLEAVEEVQVQAQTDLTDLMQQAVQAVQGIHLVFQDHLLHMQEEVVQVEKVREVPVVQVVAVEVKTAQEIMH